MKVDGIPYRSIWRADDNDRGFEIIDQTRLPHEFVTRRIETLEEAAVAIRDMWVRGAPLIGATAAYGIALAMDTDPSDENLDRATDLLMETRPTAVNLRWALHEMRNILKPMETLNRAEAAFMRADAVAEEDVSINSSIGEYGLEVLKEIWAAKKAKGAETLNILTHCNAGWLATVDWGTATAPIYKAYAAGIPVHVWVDETRPRNQGASLTAWELGHHGVPHTVVTDNTGGHLMQHGEVDIVITGTDRTTATGDVCNKIGTYLKALAAKDNNVPFYVALPSPTIDWTIDDGIKQIPIEERDEAEVTHIAGKKADGSVETVQLVPDGSPARNYGFDVTPARLVSGLITERGVARATRNSLANMYPERAK